MTHLLGGVLIGLAASALLLLNGRVLGITGIVAGLLGPDARWRALFVAGIPTRNTAAYDAYLRGLALAAPAGFASTVHQRAAVLVVGGLLVGYGTRLGGGCTSGHGVCGISRLSPRSLTATAVFMGFGALTVFIVRHVL